MYGVNTFNPILLVGAAVAGAVIAIPVSLIVARKINQMISGHALT